MTGFLSLAILMTLIVTAAIAIPLLRPAADAAGAPAARAPWAALVSVVLLFAGSAALYVNVSNWNWSAPTASDTPAGMVAQLARRLEQNPSDAEGWLMLGRSYAVLEQVPLALRAYERADQLFGGKNAEALLGVAETLVLQNESEIDGRAGQLFERALVLEPDSGKALFFGGVAASRRGELPLARARFAKLLTLDPPANVRPMLEQQIKAIDERLAGRAGGEAAVAPAPAATAAAVAAPGAAAPAAVVKVNVSLSPQLRATVGGAPLFVIVRDPQAPGPPLAAKRLASTFPQQVELTPADSMIAGRSFRSGQTVQVVARISRSGSPVAQSGDPFGEAPYAVGTDGLREIVIDRLSP